MLKKEIKKYIILAVILFILPIFTVPVVYADTNGNELKTTKQPDKLILNLGKEYAGMEFELKLDSGIFPVPVKVDKSGVLIMELGGSKTYTLTRLKPAAIPETTKPDLTTEAASINIPSPNSEIYTEEPIISETDIIEPITEPEPVDNSIPLLHVILLLSGIILIAGGYFIIRVWKRRRTYYDFSDYDDDDE